MPKKKKQVIEQKTEVVKTRTLGKTTEKTLKYTRQNANGDYYKMNIADITNILKGIEKEAQKNKTEVNTIVRVVSNLGTTTLKGYSDEIDSVEYYEDYFKNKVKETDNFEEFYQVYITYKLR